MHSDSNQDGSARVRHVPIHIESRSSSSSGNDRQSPGQSYCDHATRQTWQQQQQQPNDRYNVPHQQNRQYASRDSQTSPDTSSININYKPPPPNRRQQQQHYQPGSETSANRQQQYESPSSSYDEFQRQHQKQQQQYQQQQETRQAEKERLNSSRSMSPNSDKLVNSPEPIPLPPPQSNNGTASPDNNSRNAASQHQQQPEQQHKKQQEQQHGDGPVCRDEDLGVMDAITRVKMNVMELVQQITKFDGLSSESKDYRYLEEMLDRCVLKLDNIQCGESSELRKQRKAAINLVDRATDILQRKMQINSDIHNLSASMEASSANNMNPSSSS